MIARMRTATGTAKLWKGANITFYGNGVAWSAYAEMRYPLCRGDNFFPQECVITRPGNIPSPRANPHENTQYRYRDHLLIWTTRLLL